MKHIMVGATSLFVHIDFLNGGPILNTAAVNTYWKQETKNRAEFSKFVDSSLSEFPGSYGGGGVYLLNFSRCFNAPVDRSPCLCPDPIEGPELHDGSDENLSDDAGQNLLRDQTRCGTLDMKSRVG